MSTGLIALGAVFLTRSIDLLAFKIAPLRRNSGTSDKIS